MGSRDIQRSQRRVRAVVQSVRAQARALFLRINTRANTRTTIDARSSRVSRPTRISFPNSSSLLTSTAIVAQHFLDATKSQLTYHGLFQLASTLQPGSLVALFRNAHLSVVYKSPGGTADPIHPQASVDSDSQPNPSADSDSSPHPPPDADAAASNPTPSRAVEQDSALHALVTDDAFLHESSIVWERLEDVDGGSSWFVDSNFRRAVPVGGDVAGQTAEGALRQFEMEAGLYGIVDPAE